MMVSKTNLLLQGAMFRFHVKLSEGIYSIHCIHSFEYLRGTTTSIHCVLSKSQHLTLLAVYLLDSRGEASLLYRNEKSNQL